MINTPIQEEGSQAVEPQDGDHPLASQVEALKGELEQLRAESLRERADLDNQRKRLAREVEQARRFANERLLGELLPLFDSMEAGLAAAAQNDPLREGLELTLRQLHRIAEANGLVEVAPAPGVRIFIGEETGLASLQGMSLVTAPYTSGDRVLGVLGVIGPSRMAYDRVIPVVQAAADVLGAAIEQPPGG